MATTVSFLYSGVYIASDTLASIQNNIVDTDPSDRLDWLGLDPALRPLSIFYFLNGNDYIYLTGDVANNVYSGAGDDEVNGGDGNDTLFGAGGDDQLSGEIGDDVLNGWTGGDALFGGIGQDSLYGGTGDDALYGDAGNDRINGGTGGDEINGGDDNDTVYGEAGSDILFGGNGNDDVRGGSEDDAVFGGEGDDNLRGSEGEDFVFGDAGNDTVRGGLGDDYVGGGDGNDDLRGSYGDDELHGGLGSDLLAGGQGADTFYFEFASESGRVSAGVVSQDTIIRFESGLDVISLGDVFDRVSTPDDDPLVYLGVAAAFTAVGQLRLEQSGADTLVHVNTNSAFATSEMIIRLANLNAATLTVDDFGL